MLLNTPYKVLVCLVAVTGLAAPGMALSFEFEDFMPAASSGVEADALSADPRTPPPLQAAPLTPRSVPPLGSVSGGASSGGSRSIPYVSHGGGGGHHVSGGHYGGGRAAVRGCPAGMACTGGAGCDGSCPTGLTAWFPGNFLGVALPDIGIRNVCAGAYLPRAGCKRFQLIARLWAAKMNSSTVLWGSNLIGGPGQEVDMSRDLHIGPRWKIPEFEAMFKIRENWACRYTFMPISYTAVVGPDINHPLNFFFGNINFHNLGAAFRTDWDRKIHKWSLVYDWFQAPWAVSSLFAGYALYNDKLQITQLVAPDPPFALWSRTRSRDMHLANAGISLDKVMRDVGGGTASLHCTWSMQFLEGWLGWDGQAVLRMAVPMNCGRYGYFESGWRWNQLSRNQPTDRDKVGFDGWTGSVGLIF